MNASTGPVHLVLDSTGLELFGQGEWCAAKHGRLRQRWLKLHLGVDASTGEIAAHVLTDGDEDDAVQAPALLRQCEGTLASVTADGAYVSMAVESWFSRTFRAVVAASCGVQDAGTEELETSTAVHCLLQHGVGAWMPG